MNKVVVALGLSKLPIPQRIELARLVVASMTGNANFTTPSPALTVITANANALETAYIAAKSGGRDETALMHAKEQVLALSLKALAAYVEATANASPANAEAIVLSAGIGLRRPNAARPNGFRLSHGDHSGEIVMRTDSDPRAIFSWAMTQTPADETSWTIISSSTRSQYTIDGLQTGTRYYFRVCKTGKDGVEPWSHVLDMVAA